MLRLAQLTKRFGAFTALEAISFEVEAGEIVALLGENGAGKSTTISLIGGEQTPDQGTIELAGEVCTFRNPRAAAAAGIGIVHQHFTLVPTFTVAESLAFQATSGGALYRPREWEEKARSWAGLLGWQLDPRRRIRDLSVGEQQRVEILKALFGGSGQTRLLLLDEPTANLTPRETDELFETLTRLRQQKLALVFVSHKLREVMALCDRAVILRRGKLVGQSAINQTNPAELADLMVGTAEASARDEASLGLQTRDKAVAPVLSPGPARLKLVNVCGSTLKNANLEVRAGEIVGLAGVDGNGQQELFELLAGMSLPRSGTVEIVPHAAEADAPPALGGADPSGGPQGGIGLVPPDRRTEGLILSFDIAENLALSATFRRAFCGPLAFDWPAARTRALELMQQYDIRSPQTDGKVGAERTAAGRLSGGNAQKVVLARALDAEPGLVVVVDPTRGLDVGASAFVHQQLRAAAQRGAAVLLLSTDLDEVLALSNRVGACFAGQILPTHSALLGANASRENVGRLMGGDESFLSGEVSP